MPRKAKGYSKAAIKKKGKWYGRLRISTTGKEYARQAENKTHARKVASDLEAKYISGGVEALDAEDMTLADLAERYRKAKVVDAVYDDGIKIAGMIDAKTANNEINVLLAYWGAVPIQRITHAAIERYKMELLKTPTFWRWRKGDGQIEQKERNTPRTMVNVNHYLRRLRTMLNFAKRQGWIAVNPFNQGEPLISTAAEGERNRAEREGELEKLLGACTGQREYLKPIILIMVDSALRLAEAKRLTRANLDFERKLAYVAGRNTNKNLRTRIIPLSDRVVEELQKWAAKAKDDNTPILEQWDHKKAWKAAKKAAGISDDLQLRDLRGWGTSRIAKALAAAGLPWQWGMKATGHTQSKTYERYLKTDEEVALQTGEALKKLKNKVA